VTNGSYAVRSVLSAYSGLEVQGASYDEFYAELTALLGEERAKRYLAFRIWQIDQEMETAKAGIRPAADATSVTPEQGLQNVKGDPGRNPTVNNPPVNEAPRCAGHGLPKVKRQSGPTSKNPGKWFYACSKPKNEQCDNSFEWA
jgi:hypothetical protein